MTRRNHDLHLRLNDEEFHKLDTLVTKSGLSREAYLRQIISGLQPRNQPPKDYHLMMRQLYHCGNALNQIARKAHALNMVDVQKYDEAVEQYRETVRNINHEVIQPEKIRHGDH
ncbi:MAG: plasmid mobilization relaxosome protein MobC [Oscillospiraceae bacterium]|nr:plasmid mobilization relaxosome protein MobC [Oscillospiraceae bacterium]